MTRDVIDGSLDATWDGLRLNLQAIDGPKPATSSEAEPMCAVCEHDEHGRDCEHCSCEYGTDWQGRIEPATTSEEASDG